MLLYYYGIIRLSLSHLYKTARFELAPKCVPQWILLLLLSRFWITTRSGGCQVICQYLFGIARNWALWTKLWKQQALFRRISGRSSIWTSHWISIPIDRTTRPFFPSLSMTKLHVWHLERFVIMIACGPACVSARSTIELCLLRKILSYKRKYQLVGVCSYHVLVHLHVP